VSIKQIQEESGISIGSIYYHFENKDEILDIMVKTYLKDSFFAYENDIKNFDGDFIEKLNFIFRYKASLFGTKSKDNLQFLPKRPKFDHKEYFTLFKSIFHHYPKVRHHFYELNKKLFNLYCELFQEAVENNEIRDDIDIKTLAVFVQTTLKGYTDMWSFHSELSLEEIVDDNIKMIWEAIKK
jgi:AcrR family transcriptional regulator